MNQSQFNMIADKLIKNQIQADAIYLHMINGYSAYQSEVMLHGKVTNTVSRDAKRIQSAYDFSVKLINLGK